MCSWGPWCLQTDDDDRPKHPASIKGTEVIWNPFEDIVPRTTPEERQAVAAANRYVCSASLTLLRLLLHVPQGSASRFMAPASMLSSDWRRWLSAANASFMVAAGMQLHHCSVPHQRLLTHSGSAGLALA